MNDLQSVIATEKKHITTMSPDDCVNHARLSDPVADALDIWLVAVGFGTTDVSDPAYNAWLLLHAACDRATEIVCMDAMECDEDHCYPLEEPYNYRVSAWTETLADLVTHKSPMVIAENSTAIITGLNRGITEEGAHHPAVLKAWAEVRREVEAAWPNKVRKYQHQRMTAHERQVAYAR